MVRRLPGAVSLAVAAVAATLSGCDGVVPGDSYEERPYALDGELLSALPTGVKPLMAVIWTDPWEQKPDIAMPLAWMDSTVVDAARKRETSNASEDGFFKIRLFRAPPPEALVTVPSRITKGEAVTSFGELQIVDDVDADGTFAIDAHGTLLGEDRYVAGSETVLVHLSKPFADPFDQAFQWAAGREPGYQLFYIQCSGRTEKAITVSQSVSMSPQTSKTLVERRVCLRTHTP